MAPKTKFKLNSEVIGRSDVIKLKRELDNLENKISEVRAKKERQRISISKTLHQTADDNGIDLNKQLEREKLQDELSKLIETAPNFQISFASTPSHEFMSNLTDWFRKEVHPQVLVSVGLQPSIAAGCVLRTTNKVFDLSLKKNMTQKQELLVSNLRGVYGQ